MPSQKMALGAKFCSCHRFPTDAFCRTTQVYSETSWIEDFNDIGVWGVSRSFNFAKLWNFWTPCMYIVSFAMKSSWSSLISVFSLFYCTQNFYVCQEGVDECNIWMESPQTKFQHWFNTHLHYQPVQEHFAWQHFFAAACLLCHYLAVF